MNRLSNPVRIAVLGAALALLSACSGSGRPNPAPLENFVPGQAVKTVWTAKIGSSSGPMSMVTLAGAVTVASSDGVVASFETATGKERWRTQTGARLSAGVGSDGRFVAVVTQDNELLVLDGPQVRWRDKLSSRVITAPLVAGERVFVQGVDRSVRAYDALDGRWLWSYQRPGTEPLALAQQGVLTAFRDTLITGSGSRLVALDPLRGTVRSDVSLGQPRGTNEVERLSDLVGPAARSEDDLCVRSFQLSVGCVNMNRGALRWSRPQAGYQGLAADDRTVVGADSADRITAWRADTGETRWRVDRFQYRNLSTPAIWGGLMAFGDSEGQLHLLSAADGRTVARVSLDSALTGAPKVQEGLLLAATRNGTLYALRAQ